MQYGRSLIFELARALRIHQWPKNLLVFLPALTSQKFDDPHLFAASLEAFLAFCAAASAVYLINDLADREHDRQHPAKRLRPFAAGTLSTRWCYVLIPLLVGATIAVGLALGWSFLIVIMLYALLAVAYSMALKRILMLDVILIAVFYGLRVIAGYEATHLEYSIWLISFTQFLFISLAFMKRDIGLARLKKTREDPAGRGYVRQDRSVIGAFGISSGLISVLVLSFYIDSHVVKELYRHPWVLWLACPIVGYGVGRIWILANRGAVDDDPVTFVLRDPVSYVLGGCLALVALLAKFGLPGLGGG
ncbi:MAG TPA: UbiA family prenyltransferase [Rhizobiales bacterium]|nr:UbiA family prenyltransferase [Hyphomicrobiales bacterium]